VAIRTHGGPTLEDVVSLSIRYLSTDEVAEAWCRHQMIVEAHERCLEDGDAKTLACMKCGMDLHERAYLLAHSTQSPAGVVLDQMGIDMVAMALGRMLQHKIRLAALLDLDGICRITGQDRAALEERLPPWRALLQLGA